MMGPAPITYQDFAAWNNMMQYSATPEEVSILKAMDFSRLAALDKLNQKKG